MCRDQCTGVNNATIDASNQLLNLNSDQGMHMTKSCTMYVHVAEFFPFFHSVGVSAIAPAVGSTQWRGGVQLLFADSARLCHSL